MIIRGRKEFKCFKVEEAWRGIMKLNVCSLHLVFVKFWGEFWKCLKALASLLSLGFFSTQLHYSFVLVYFPLSSYQAF